MGRVRLPSTLLASSLLALSATGCGKSLRPADPTASGASGETCDPSASSGEPLIVDWQSNQRGDLEEAMHDGVAVVAYDCKSLKLLRGCSIDGTYGFMGFSKKEDVIRLQDSQEIAVNLPTFGVSLIKELDADLSQGTSLDLATVLVGKQRTTFKQVDRDALVGGAACAGATHFVRGSFVGAFAMGTSSKASADVSVSSIFSASAKSSSSRVASHRDGDPQACTQADPLADSPAASCSAPVRLELWALARDASGPSAAPGDADPATICPQGSVYRAGKCAPSATPANGCFTLAYEGCDKLCQGGDLDGCERAADEVVNRFVQTRAGGNDDLAYAAGLYEKTCAAGNAIGCNQRGYMHAHGIGGPKDDAAAARLYDKSCLMGNEQACNNLAFLDEDGRGVKRDPTQAVALYKRACNGGRAVACGNLGVMYQRGHGVAVDALAASVFYKRACDGLDGASCWRLSVMMFDHDPTAAARAAKRGAQAGDPSSQDLYGRMLEEGKAGLTADPKAAAALYASACGETATDVDATDPEGCTHLGYLYAHGTGVTADPARAAVLYKLGCDRKDGGGCNQLGLLVLDGNGAPKDPKLAVQLFERACKLEDSGGCGNLGQVKEQGRGTARDPGGAVKMYQLGCKGGDGWSCDQLKRLGKSP